MDNVFIYWDNSNMFIGAQQVAVEREGEGARYRVRIHFGHLLDWHARGATSSMRPQSVPYRPSCSTSGIAWKTKA